MGFIFLIKLKYPRVWSHTLCGRTSTTDAEHSGRPIGIASFEMMKETPDRILANQRFKVCDVVKAKGILYSSGFSIGP